MQLSRERYAGSSGLGSIAEAISTTLEIAEMANLSGGSLTEG
jgi:hypothetical protein